MSLQDAKARATQTYARLMKQLDTKSPEPPGPAWQEMLLQAQSLFRTGQAPSLHEALGQVARAIPTCMRLSESSREDASSV